MRSAVIALFLFFTVGIPVFGSALTDAHKDYLFGDYQEAIRKAQSLKTSDEQLYFLGLVHIKMGEYNTARAYLERLSGYFPRSMFKIQAALKIADSYFLEQDFQTAEKMYKEIKNRHTSFDSMPHVYLRLIQISAKAGNWQEKNKLIKTFKEKYPKSSEASFITAIESYGDFFTIQVGAFSEKKNALVLENELSKKYKVYVVQDKDQSYPLFKVRIGRYHSRHEVEQVSAGLRQEGYPARIYP